MSSKLLFFSTEDCVACHAMKPMVARQAKKNNVVLDEHDPISEPGLAQKYNVNIVPTVVLVDERQQYVGELSGGFDEKTLDTLFACAM